MQHPTQHRPLSRTRALVLLAVFLLPLLGRDAHYWVVDHTPKPLVVGWHQGAGGGTCAIDHFFYAANVGIALFLLVAWEGSWRRLLIACLRVAPGLGYELVYVARGPPVAPRTVVLGAYGTQSQLG